jgi:hypothetical protein
LIYVNFVRRETLLYLRKIGFLGWMGILWDGWGFLGVSGVNGDFMGRMGGMGEHGAGIILRILLDKKRSYICSNSGKAVNLHRTTLNNR